MVRCGPAVTAARVPVRNLKAKPTAIRINLPPSHFSDRPLPESQRRPLIATDSGRIGR